MNICGMNTQMHEKEHFQYWPRMSTVSLYCLRITGSERDLPPDGTGLESQDTDDYPILNDTVILSHFLHSIVIIIIQ